jgi:molybdopterin-binding protein
MTEVGRQLPDAVKSRFRPSAAGRDRQLWGSENALSEHIACYAIWCFTQAPCVPIPFHYDFALEHCARSRNTILRYQQSSEEENMKLSARNILPATVKAVTPGAVDTEVVVELAPGIEIVSIITKQSAEKLGLKPGAKAYAIVKASNVMIGVD